MNSNVKFETISQIIIHSKTFSVNKNHDAFDTNARCSDIISSNEQNHLCRLFKRIEATSLGTHRKH